MMVFQYAKIIFLKLSIPHFRVFAKSRPAKDVAVQKYTLAVDHVG
jgi:hypothetical protein